MIDSGNPRITDTNASVTVVLMLTGMQSGIYVDIILLEGIRVFNNQIYLENIIYM